MLNFCRYFFIFRNVVTGEHYRFVTLWMSRVSYVFALGIMVAFVSNLFNISFYLHFIFFVLNKKTLFYIKIVQNLFRFYYFSRLYGLLDE